MKFRCYSYALLVHTSGFRQRTLFPLWPRPQQEQHKSTARCKEDDYNSDSDNSYIDCVIFVGATATTVLLLLLVF